MHILTSLSWGRANKEIARGLRLREGRAQPRLKHLQEAARPRAVGAVLYAIREGLVKVEGADRG